MLTLRFETSRKLARRIDPLLTKGTEYVDRGQDYDEEGSANGYSIT